ncbi:hypothetical protein RRG08_002943 [Elysia crispata]|uniref:Uncharacterized protein n=1 Tax=Elysia crispata TaxID=231223 RepID=A0AAE1APN6_9GAST|nr:hypothetical protein RRG08_002943 [Elysia crispata]
MWIRKTKVTPLEHFVDLPLCLADRVIQFGLVSRSRHAEVPEERSNITLCFCRKRVLHMVTWSRAESLASLPGRPPLVQRNRISPVTEICSCRGDKTESRFWVSGRSANFLL